MLKKYKTIDLCAGIGGIRRGFELSGRFENILSAEIDEYACQTYMHLFNDNPQNDITSNEFKKQVSKINYQVLLAGFPCQTFSRAGKQEGFEDLIKGTIFFDIIKIMQKKRPEAIFLENVDNLISHDNGNTFKTIIEILELEMNYKVIGVCRKNSKKTSGILKYEPKNFIRNTINFGLPQNRPRLYIMAFDKKKFGKKTKKLYNELPRTNNKKIFDSVDNILEHQVEKKYYMSSGYLETLKKHKERNKKAGNGFGYQILNEMGKEKSYAHTITATGGSGKERNLIIDPQENIAGIMLPSKKSGLNNECVRVMTPVEWGRLQGFIGYGFLDEYGVDKFTFPNGISDAQKYKQFGNSVSIPVIEEMAKFLAECLDLLNDQTIENKEE